MRTFRFRAWDKQKKEWLPNDTLIDFQGVLCKDDCQTLGIEAEIMQYTGLKDKNGKEIYEGDILESEAFIDTFDWMDGCYSFKRDMESLPITEHYPYEVIGNIYENPNLLSQDK